jgi:hypothetical protein
MKKFDQIIEKYRNKGVGANNIEYAIDSVKDGTKRELILDFNNKSTSWNLPGR